ncbi:MAG: RHS repeat-associated core domain-containing protein, partial [Patescibacteria group bacterium]
ENRNYAYDLNNNVLEQTNASGVSLYTYDALDRLIQETSATIGNLAYSYDPNGNRLSFLDNGETKNYSYSPNTNRLTQIGHKEVVLDAAGNTISDAKGKRTFEYLPSGRLFKVYKERKWVATYLYNAQGQRTQKITKHGTTIYHYDLQGHLIAEAAKDGTLQRAYVWLDDQPLAQIDVKGHHDDKGKDKHKHKAKEQIAFLHTDHLGTPRLATDTNQQVVWRWEADAFGTKKPEDHDDEHEDDDDREITVNLRFAGQYADKETRLFYNWHRYYDPKTGRSITADPRSVGKHVDLMLDRMNAPKLLRSLGVTVTPDVNAPPLELNSFVYVANNPLRWTDSTGEGIGVLVPIIGGTCFTMYCAIQAKNYCEATYPSSGGLENDRKRVECFSERVKFCVTFGAYIMDPIGSGAATIGEEAGKKMCKECEH